MGFAFQRSDGGRLAEQELAFIGIEMDQPVIESALIACLQSNEKTAMGPADWAEMDDPFAALPLPIRRAVPEFNGPSGPEPLQERTPAHADAQTN